jgi:site-specific recombinase XerD
MTPLAPHLSAFLNERLPLQRNASPHTRTTYAYAFQLLVCFASERLKVQPSDLQLEQLDSGLVLAFLEHLETSRENGPSSRNARLAAIKSFFRFVQYRVPSALEQVQRILALPIKKADTKLVAHLDVTEMKAILDVPDPTTRDGIRDRAMLYLGFTIGLRVSEIVGLRVEDVTFEGTATVVVRGKGRRQRCLPLCADGTKALRAWLAVRGPAAVPELFLNARGQAMSRWGFTYRLRLHVGEAAKRCPSIAKKRVSPHVLRHTCAMVALQATKDVRKVSLWLGHASVRTTEIYTRVNPNEKLEVIERLTPAPLRRGRYRPPDRLLAVLKEASRYVQSITGESPMPAHV